MQDKILEVEDLEVRFITDEETAKAVNGVSFSIAERESLGLVGETGAGKTTIALSVMQLVPDPPGIITGGKILYQGVDLIKNSEKENRKIRGNGISMIFQDPMTALNPTMTIGEQLAEVIQTHQKLPKAKVKEQVIELLQTVGIESRRYDDYPHQFSGGQKQRVVIAMALLCNPKLLIADEPTTALDVTIQAQVLEIIKGLRDKFNMSMLLITHDLGIVAETCDNVAIMYAGQIVEYGSVRDVYKKPSHPYTRGLFNSIPKLDEDTDELIPIEGQISNAADLPTGCYFHPRCQYCKEICKTVEPETRGTTHKYKCHFDLINEEG